MKCSRKIAYGSGFHFRQCDHDAVSGNFCKIHDPQRPDKVARRKRAAERFEARLAPYRKLDRYREALDRIANEFMDECKAQAIAQGALQAEGEFHARRES